MKNIYNMKLHEVASDVAEKPNRLGAREIERVPGGWNYIYFIKNQLTSTFVPWHDSGRQIASNGNYEELRTKLNEAENIIKELEHNLLEPNTRDIAIDTVDEAVTSLDIIKKYKFFNKK